MFDEALEDADLNQKVQEMIKEILDSESKPYPQRERDRFNGPRNFGKGFALREDFYAAGWLHQFHLQVLTN